MSHLRLLATLTLLSLAGCSDTVAPEPEATSGFSVEGWVVDPNIQPVVGAIVAGGTYTATTDAEGYYRIEAISEPTITLHFAADGMQSSSRTLQFSATEHQRVDVTLLPVPDNTPYTSWDKFSGYIECSAFVAVGHDHGGGEPSGESPTDCGTYASTRNAWDEEILPGLDGLVVETIWTPNTELAEFLLMIVYQLHDNGTLEYLGYAEGPSPLKVHLPSLDVQERFKDGGWLHTKVEIGGNPDGEDVAAGAAIDQTFEGFTSQFFGMIPSDDYSIA